MLEPAAAGSRRSRWCVQCGLAEAAAGNLVRQARDSGHAQDPTGQPSTRKTCSKSSPQPIPCPVDPGVSRSRQAQIDVHRHAPPEQINQATGRIHTSYHRRLRRPADSRRPIRICRISRSGPGRAAHSAGLRGAAGTFAGRRGLFTNRIAHHGAFVARCELLRAFAETATSIRRPPPRGSPRPWAKSVPISGALPRPSISLDVRDVGIRAPPDSARSKDPCILRVAAAYPSCRGSPNADIPYIANRN